MLLATGILLGYFSFISWAIGFLIAKYLGGKTIGERGRLRSFFIPLGKRKIHLHHWLLSSLVMGITLTKGIYFPFSDVFYGFFGGIVFHGIYFYRDWHKICEHPMRPTITRREIIWVLLWAGLVAAITALPYIRAVQLAPDNHHFSGFIWGVDDGNVYLSWIRHQRHPE